MKRRAIIIIIVIFILLIASYFIPVKSEEYIKIDKPMETGGPIYKKGYNIYGVKLYDKRR